MELDEFSLSSFCISVILVRGSTVQKTRELGTPDLWTGTEKCEKKHHLLLEKH